MTVPGSPDTLTTWPPGDIVIRYPLIARPLPPAPLQLRVTWPVPFELAATVALVTGEGAPNGVAVALASESSPPPTTLVAEMRKV